MASACACEEARTFASRGKKNAQQIPPYVISWPQSRKIRRNAFLPPCNGRWDADSDLIALAMTGKTCLNNNITEPLDALGAVGLGNIYF